jgi:hypothetical protein
MAVLDSDQAAGTGPLTPAAPVVPPPETKKEPEKPTDPNLDVTKLIPQVGRGGVEAARANKPFDAAIMQMNPPQLERPPKPKPENESIANAWGAAAMAFGVLMGRKSQTPVTAALNAAAGALTGLQEGKYERANEAMQRWKVENDNALKMGEYNLRTYHELIDKYMQGRDINVMRGKAIDAETKGKFDAINAATGGDPAMEHAFTQGWGAVMDTVAHKEQAQERLKHVSKDAVAWGMMTQELAETEKQYRDQGLGPVPASEKNKIFRKWYAPGGAAARGKALTTPEDIENTAKLMAQGVLPVPQTPMGPGWAEALERMHEINPAMDYYVSRQIQADLKDIGTGRAANQLQSFEAVSKHLQVLEDVVNRMPGDLDIGKADAIVRAWAASGRGDPLVTSFRMLQRQVSTELTKAIVGGTTAAKDRDETAKTFGEDLNKAQLKGNIDTAKKLVHGQVDAISERNLMLKQFKPEVYKKYFEKEWMPYIAPERWAMDASGRMVEKQVPPRSSQEQPLEVSNMADVLTLPADGRSWIKDEQTGQAVQVTQTVKDAIARHLKAQGQDLGLGVEAVPYTGEE